MKISKFEKDFEGIKNILEIDSLADALYFPKFVQIETVRVCNAKCPFCAQDKWNKTVPFMSDTLFEKIVDEIKDYSDWIRWVTIQKAGEPLLDKKICDRIRQIKEAGIKHVNLSTNVSLLSEEKAKELICAGLDEISFSIDAVDKEQYQLMRVGLDYDTVINNIRSFFRVRDELNPDLIVRVRGVSFYDLSDDEERKKIDQWEIFWDELKKPHDRIYMKKAHDWGNQKKWDGHQPDSYGVFHHPCIIPWSTMTISAMGIVGLCVQDYDSKMNLGDVNKESIRDIWQNDKWNNIRRLHANGDRNDISFCQGCVVYDQDHSLEKK